MEDEDDWPDKLSCEACSDLTIKCEIVFDSRTNRYNIATSDLENLCSWQRKRIQDVVAKNKGKHLETLRLLREKVEIEREQSIHVDRNDPKERERRKEIMKEAKRKLKNFLPSPPVVSSSGGDTVATTPAGSSNKRYKRTVTPTKSAPNTISSRVSVEKLDFFKAALSKLLEEKRSGVQSAWEMIYKKVVNEHILCVPKQDVKHKTEDFLLELNELDNDWKEDSDESADDERDADEQQQRFDSRMPSTDSSDNDELPETVLRQEVV